MAETSQQLQDKVIFITGAAGQLGKVSVRMFLERGATIVANDIVDLEQSDALTEIGKQYGEERFIYVKADCTDEQAVMDAFALTERKFGRLDGLFHNAYKQGPKPIIETSLEQWNAIIAGTLTSTFIVNKHAVLLMLKSGGGSIVNTSSIISTKFPKLENSGYGSAKAGVNQFTRILAAEYGQRGIRANVLMPGTIAPKEKIAELNEAAKDRIGKMVMLGTNGPMEHVAEVAAFLLSDASAYVTGALYEVDGGFAWFDVRSKK